MRRRAGLGLGGAVAAGVLAWGLWPVTIPDPVVRGKPLSAWLDERRRPRPLGPVVLSAEATEAVRSLGPDAVPTLLAWLRIGDSAIVRGSNAVGQLLRVRGVVLRGHAVERTRAALGFQALGPAGRPAWPAIAEVALHESDAEQYLDATFALWEADAEAARLFVPATGDPDPLVRSRAMRALAMIHRAAHEVGLPTLERLRADPDPSIATQAAGLIAYMKAMLGSLVPNLKHPDAAIRVRTARSIAGHGPHAERYLPELEAAAGDPDPAVRAAVAEAIRRVRPPAP